MSVSTYRVLGVSVNPITMPELTDFVVDAIERRRHVILGCHNLHSIYVYHRDARMRDLYRTADLVQIDGMGIVAVARLLGYPVTRKQRVTYLDWMWPLLRNAAERKFRVAYVGTRAEVCAKITERLRRDLPELTFSAMCVSRGEMAVDADESQRVLARVAHARPEILFVGMGMPRQEHWILDHRDQITANVILPCGAAMDYLAGLVPTPPRWIGAIGLEWAYRLLSEPRRMWKRYLLEPWTLLWLFARDLFRRQS